MLQATPIPDVYTLRLSDWDLSQPAEKGGYGSRTVIICKVSLLGTQVTIQYLRHEAYSREAPSVPWRHVQTYVAPLNTGLEAVIRGHFLTEVIAALSPVGVVSGHTDQDTDGESNRGS